MKPFARIIWLGSLDDGLMDSFALLMAADFDGSLPVWSSSSPLLLGFSAVEDALP
jgi:hypothetical protein